MKLGHIHVMAIVYNADESRCAAQAFTQGTHQCFAATSDTKRPHYMLKTQPLGN